MKKIITIVIVIILVSAGVLYLWYGRAVNEPWRAGAERQAVVIGAGSGVKSIAGQLFEQEIIRSAAAFKWYVKDAGLAGRLQAGTYELGPDMSVRDIVKVLATGLALTDERNITFIEGWTLKDMDNYLAEAAIIQPGELLAAARPDHDFSFLAGRPAGMDLEGFIFPDTYRIFNSASVEDIIRRALQNFDRKLDAELRAEIERQNKSIWEIVTMASLIEKEVRSYDDMRLVSGVFWNRIRAGQALESCASLAYILGVNKPQYSFEDTRVESVYNTYLHPGLPPGPVSNPGLNAIKAAVYPAPSDYYYFLSRSDNGETVFSRSYDEHLRNKARYLK